MKHVIEDLIRRAINGEDIDSLLDSMKQEYGEHPPSFGLQWALSTIRREAAKLRQPESPPSHGGAKDESYVDARRQAVCDFERSYIESVLARTGGNITHAARIANLDRSNFKRVMRRVHAEPEKKSVRSA